MKTVITGDEMQAGQIEGKGCGWEGAGSQARGGAESKAEASLSRKEPTSPRKFTAAHPKVTFLPTHYQLFFFFSSSFYDLTIFGMAKINLRGAESFIKLIIKCHLCE